MSPTYLHSRQLFCTSFWNPSVGFIFRFFFFCFFLSTRIITWERGDKVDWEKRKTKSDIKNILTLPPSPLSLPPSLSSIMSIISLFMRSIYLVLQKSPHEAVATLTCSTYSYQSLESSTLLFFHLRFFRPHGSRLCSAFFLMQCFLSLSLSLSPSAL